MSDLNAVIDRMGQGWTGDPAAMDDLLADDVVIETPFAPDGPKRWNGRGEWLAFARSGRNELPVTLDRFTKLAVHETVDPEVAVIEYELGGLVTTTGQRASARFIGVLRVRDGKIAGWREYQDTYAIRQALG